MMDRFCLMRLFARSAGFVALATAPLFVATANPVANVTAPTSAQPQKPLAEPAVEVVTAFHAALKQGDTNAALKLMSDDVVIFESGAVERSRAEYEAHHLKSDAAFSAATTRTPVSQTVTTDGNLSTVMSVENVVGNYRGRPINSRSIETMVLRKTDGQWRVVHIHWSSANITAK